MYELIYADREVEDIIKKEYPEAKITDASDFIHTERFECEVEVAEDEFYIFAIRNGFAEAGLSFQLMMEDFPKGEGNLQKLWDWIAEAKALDESEELTVP